MQSWLWRRTTDCPRCRAPDARSSFPVWLADWVGQGGIEGSSTGTVAPDAGGSAAAVATHDAPPPGPNGKVDPQGHEADADRAAMRVADVVFAVVAVATFVFYFVKSRGVVLNGDDWATVPRGNTF